MIMVIARYINSLSFDVQSRITVNGIIRLYNDSVDLGITISNTLSREKNRSLRLHLEYLPLFISLKCANIFFRWFFAFS